MFNKYVLVLAGALSLAGCSDDGGDDYMPTGNGPATSLRCTSSNMNAFDTYGVDAFVAVNEAIFTNVLADLDANGDTKLGASFGGVTDFPHFKGRLAAFLVFVYGGPDSIQYTDGKMYEGSTQNMTAAHTGMGITDAQYDYFVANVVVPALMSSGVPMDDIGSCFAPPIQDATFKASIVGK